MPDGEKMKNMIEKLENCPVIAAVKDNSGLEECLKMDVEVVFVLYGTVCTISDIVKQIKDRGKTAVVHIDLIQGLSGKEAAVEFLKNYTCADGIITTKPALVKYAKELGMFTVLRYFVIDSMAYDNIQKQTASYRPDVIEILPGLMPKVIGRVQKSVRCPVIAGGLISEKEDIFHALKAGAIAISTTNVNVWKM